MTAVSNRSLLILCSFAVGCVFPGSAAGTALAARAEPTTGAPPRVRAASRYQPRRRQGGAIRGGHRRGDPGPPGRPRRDDQLLALIGREVDGKALFADKERRKHAACDLLTPLTGVHARFDEADFPLAPAPD